MGVPKFYRWISERYPLINQVLSDSTLLPDIDNFYLDMNGIIHACTHPNDQDASKSLSMRDMMLGLFRYIDRMVSEIVRPKKILFMAIDGVAPRAKLNQQRARRFRAAQDREDNLIKARQRGEEIDESSIFDSNCITPGTEFMDSVGKHLRWFIRKKIKEDPLWKNLQVIFSGHDVPGEGEHKIMEFIREERARPGYEPNQRHCMYGQDADLIMLGLASHEPHFTLLREVVQFNTKPNINPRQTVIRQTKEVQFQLLHISVLREYIQVDLARGCKWKVDQERLIDDFIFMTFLVGNDFLPHLPTLDISEHAFDVIFDAYKSLFDSKPGYLVEKGEIGDFERLEEMFRKIGEQENSILKTRDEDTKTLNSKRSRRPNLFSSVETLSAEELEEVEESKQAEYEAAIMEALGKNPSSESNPGGELVKDYRGRYYFEKFKMILRVQNADTDSQLTKLMSNYLQGLMWCLAYYVKGCISWNWYYPYHYGPMLQDMKNLKSLTGKVQFDLGEPFKPFQQLLGCLPPLSKRLVPAPYQWLMTSPASPVIQFYPREFSVDQDGKKNPWEAVVLLPFIDEKVLFEAEGKFCNVSSLSTDEKRRNTFGKILYVSFDPNVLDNYPSCNPAIQLPDISQCQSKLIEKSFLIAPGVPFKPELVVGTNKFIAGFPSVSALPMRHVSIDFHKVNVFGGESKYRSLMFELENKPYDPSSFDVTLLLGRSIFVNYPTFHEAKVVAVTTQKGEYRLIKTSELPSEDSAEDKHHKKSIAASIFESNHTTTKQFKGKVVRAFGNDGMETVCFQEYDAEASRRWVEESEIEVKRYQKGRGLPGSAGLIINSISIRLRVVVLQGMKLDTLTGARKKVFGTSEADVPIQLALWAPICLDMRFQETEELPVEKFMPYGSEVVAVSGKYRGMKGTIIGPHGPSNEKAKKKNSKRVVEVEFSCPPPESPFGYAIASTIATKYYSSKEVCRFCDIHPKVLGKVVGSLFVEPGRHDIGLNLKRNGKYQLFEYVRMEELPKDTITQPAWKRGDTVQIVGSGNADEDSGDDSPSEKRTWEFSDKAIALLKAYRLQFPQLFANLAKLENTKAYMIDQLIRPKQGETPASVIEAVMSWLKSQPFFDMQRTPLTTVCLSTAAMKAIEKAEDVRVELLKSMEIQKIKDTVPVETLFRGELVTSNDAPLQFNEDVVPRLGDRVINLVPSIAPFGLRGTVIVVHKATRYVEVIFDEEFVGGKSLQGFCSQFRGRLCSWLQLLRVSTDAEYELVLSRTAVINKPKAPVMSAAPVSHVPQSGGKTKQSNVITASPPPGRRVTDLFKKTLVQPPPQEAQSALLTETNSSGVEVIGRAPAKLGGFTISKKASAKKTELASTPEPPIQENDPALLGRAPASLGGFRIMKKPKTESVSEKTVPAEVPVAQTTEEKESPKREKKQKGEQLEEALSKMSIMRSNGSGLSALSAAAGNVDLSLLPSDNAPKMPSYVGYVSDQLLPPPPIDNRKGLPNAVKESQRSKSVKKQETIKDTTEASVPKEATPVNKPKDVAAKLVPSKVIMMRKPSQISSTL